MSKKIFKGLEDTLKGIDSDELVNVGIQTYSKNARKLVDYFREQNIEFKKERIHELLNTVFVHLNKEQIYNLAKQEKLVKKIYRNSLS